MASVYFGFPDKSGRRRGSGFNRTVIQTSGDVARVGQCVSPGAIRSDSLQQFVERLQRNRIAVLPDTGDAGPLIGGAQREMRIRAGVSDIGADGNAQLRMIEGRLLETHAVVAER